MPQVRGGRARGEGREHHHRFVHEYGYRVELDDQQQPRFFDDRGRPVPQVPRVEPASDRGWPAITAQHRELAITAETSACGWDGAPPNYGWIIDGLVLLDRL